MRKKTEAQLNEYIDSLKVKVEALDEELRLAKNKIAQLEHQIESDNKGWAIPREWRKAGLPVPRLEMHWTRDDEEGYATRCTYVLVYEHFLSINKIVGEDDKPFIGLVLGQTKSHGSLPRKTFVEQYEQGPGLHLPFRESAHACSDAKQFKLPLFVTSEDGDVAEVLLDTHPACQLLLKRGGKKVK